MDKDTKVIKNGISFCSLLTIVFIVLKLVGCICWSWVWVLAPLWIGIALDILIILIVLIIACCVKNR